jgi:DNA ligase 1
MRFADLVHVAERVAATPPRRAKVALLAEALARLGPDQIEIGAGFLAGQPRQGRVGVGGRTLDEVDAPPAAAPTLDLGDVDRALAELQSATGPGSRQQRRTLLRELFAAATAAEAGFLRALLTGDLRQGALEGVLVQAVAVAWGLDEAWVRRAVMLSGAFGAVAAAAAAGGEPALRAFRLTLFRPVQPMLASTAATLAEALVPPGPVAIEWKLDGVRFQAHKEGGTVRVYSRALHDVTTDLAEVAAAVRELPVDRAVLDGETLTIGAAGRPAPFQASVRRDAVRTPFFFDALHLDGTDLLDAPYVERRAALTRLVPPGRWVPGAVVDDLAGAEAFLADALERGHEGVVVKDLDAPYEAGRRGAGWRKVKPVHTLDLVVLAAEWGSGRRRGRLSNLHLGARDDDGGFVMLGKTFKGLTDEMLAWQTSELLARATEREGGVVHVRPELVVEVAFDGFQASPRYPGGVVLRFARVRRYRDDKSAAEADTIETVRRLHAARGGPALSRG